MEVTEEEVIEEVVVALAVTEALAVIEALAAVATSANVTTEVIDTLMNLLTSANDTISVDKRSVEYCTVIGKVLILNRTVLFSPLNSNKLNTMMLLFLGHVRLRTNHLLGADNAIKVLEGDVAESTSGLLE